MKIFSIALSLCVGFLHAASVDIQTAVSKKMLTVAATGNGGYQGNCLKVTLANQTMNPINITVPPGLIFTDQDNGAQNLMVVEEYIVELKPKQSKALDMMSMCIEHHDYSPGSGDLFVMSSLASGYLNELARLIAKNDFQNSTAQSAVWAITDKTPLGDIHALDTAMASQMINIVCQATGQPRPKVIMPKEHHLYSIRFNFAQHFKSSAKLTLKCYDEAGNVLRTYYENRVVPTGVYISTFGINRVADKGSKFIFKLTDDKGAIIQERTIAESINEPPVARYEKKLNFKYILKEPLNNASMKLYDDKGNLIEVVWSGRNLPVGGRNQSYAFFHLNGPDAVFVIKLHDSSGKVIAEERIVGPSVKR
jgi:hypothetical protein